MESKTKTCQNCQQDFVIAPEDFEFYQKIDVPAPTFCPECRIQRRMAFRKEAPIFYRGKCLASGENIITIYHPDSPIKIVEQKSWWADNWDVMEYGREYDFSRPFFEQFRDLMGDMPFPAAINDDTVNCDYCSSCNWIKDSYLTTNSGAVSENLLYCNRAIKCKDSADLYICVGCELCYQDIYCSNSYRLFFSDHCDSCSESYFLYNCRNCEYCFGCVNLRHKKYHIFNQPYAKEEYGKKLKEFGVGSYSNLIRRKNEFRDLRLNSVYKFANISKSVNVSGDEIKNSKNCQHVFDIQDCEDLKFTNWAGFGYPVKDAYDCGPGVFSAELFYEAFDSGNQSSRNFFCANAYGCRDVGYCINTHSSQDLFGCVGLRKKQYCILNKQYSKEDYEELVSKIKKQMDETPYVDKNGKVYKYGEFFPAEISPFGYSETLAQDHFPLTEKQIKEKGYVFYNKITSEYEATLKSEDLPDDIKDVKESITKEVIECGNASMECLGSGVFRIIPQELKLYKTMGLPLPRICHNCRHQEKISRRNPMRLFHRQCQCAGKSSENNLYANKTKHGHNESQCQNEFETPYASDRPEIVYCEKCYQKEVE